MEIRRDDNGIIRVEGDKSHLSNVEVENGEASSSSLNSTLFLENEGEVVLTLNSDDLSWKSLETFDYEVSVCLGIKLAPRLATEISLSDMYSVELLNYGLIHGSYHPNVVKYFPSINSHESEMHRFKVYGVQKSQSQPGHWTLATYTFGHKDLQTCRMWVTRISASLKMDVGRPKNLLVFVNPRSGKASGYRTWETVAPIFSRAEVETKVVVTERAGHAFDVMASIANQELSLYDGVIAIGGDGFFNEILNGFLLSRHKAPHPPSPSDFIHYDGSKRNSVDHDPNAKVRETAKQNEEHSPLISNSLCNGSGLGNSRNEDVPCNKDEDLEFPRLREQLRFGIIPAGSTDAIVMCTTGTRDPVTSALHIVLGKRIYLDIAQVVRWKTSLSSDIEPFVRYAASFAGYGFYGDVITESEKYRWMGPKRYDYAGTKVFLRHRSYEAEVSYIQTEPEKTNSTTGKGNTFSRLRSVCGPEKVERAVCRTNCDVCNAKPATRSPRSTPYSRPEESRWRRCKGHFLSVGAAVISNRNERAPDGLVADAHLSDGFLHLLLIRDCPRALYLWHLTQLAKRGGKPWNFEFVEHHKTPAFTFTSFGDESVWNLDGELFHAHQLSAQVFRGLISLFASGPEV
ncbi:ceramide kinase isoform X2 [Euphorbia lathyris]|uniref:ceramide kinase isoform X2 n=1 Tax=Euphorbia lathyris TaxID=212925 RepID=UPI003313EA25